MFPEIMRDEVFRLETRCAWLRWPVGADADRIEAIVAQSMVSGGSSPAFAGASASSIGRWRIANAAGQALHLMIVPKTTARLPVGLIGIAPGQDTEPELSFALHPDRQGTSLLAEAGNVLVGAAFLFGGLRSLVAMLTPAKSDAAAILAGIGFIPSNRAANVGEGPDARGRYRLERSDWRRRGGRGWFPGASGSISDAPVAAH